MKAIVDSYAWIELLGGSPLEAAVREVLSGAEVIFTPDLVLAEVARRLARDGIDRPTTLHKLQEISTLSQVVPIDARVAIEVAASDEELRRNAKARGLQKPGLSDAIVLATTKALGGKVLTGDRHFRGLAETLWLGP